MGGLIHLTAGLSGAEWSLFCPGNSFCSDSCFGFLVPSVSPSAGSAVAAFAGGKTDSADGTDVLTSEFAVAPDSAATGWLSMGVGGAGAVLSQAVKSTTDAQSAIRFNGVFMQFLGGLAGSSRQSGSRQTPSALLSAKSGSSAGNTGGSCLALWEQ
jgi:hypothetical protein